MHRRNFLATCVAGAAAVSVPLPILAGQGISELAPLPIIKFAKNEFNIRKIINANEIFGDKAYFSIDKNSAVCVRYAFAWVEKEDSLSYIEDDEIVKKYGVVKVCEIMRPPKNANPGWKDAIITDASLCRFYDLDTI